MEQRKIVIAGGGAAGFFAAIAAARANPECEVTLLEKGTELLAKVRISGGGRCNVTHACFDSRELAQHFPRGRRALIGAFHRFQPRDTIEWFAARGVPLKTESDGRMFPVTDSSQTIIDCLTGEAESAGVKLRTRCGLESVARLPRGGFELRLSAGEIVTCDPLMLATGGSRTASAGDLAVSLGHTAAPPVPSLFTFKIETPWLRTLPGVAVEDAVVSVPGTKLRERGPLLVTHWGVSGPAVLRLSAWGARELHAAGYHFPLRVNWMPARTDGALATLLTAGRDTHPGKCVVNTPLHPIPARLWAQLAQVAGIGPETSWNQLPRTARLALAECIHRTELPVTGKSLNKEEFVTCGGVTLREVDFATMESRVCPGLFFGGEVLDIDGITGGFNFQAAWTTGWIAGNAMAK